MTREELLAEAVRELFEILDIVEVSDEGKEFHPVYISSVRILLNPKIGDVLKRMKEYSDYGRGESKQN